MELSFLTLFSLFLIACIASFIDAIAGGGGMLTVPALLSSGLSPQVALATNKLSSSGGAFAASFYFIKNKQINFQEQKYNFLISFISSACGAILIQNLNADFLKQFLPFLLIAIAIYFYFSPNLNEIKQKQVNLVIFSFAIACVGFYDGFFGPGTGSFFCIIFILFQGLNIIKATANAKFMNLASNLGALLLFLLGGNINYQAGLIMLVGSLVGAHFGAKMVVLKGNKIIKPLIVCMSLLMSFKLIYENWL